MQMGPKEIAVEYRTAANRQKQIKVLAQLNQCAERRIAEILAAEGEDLPKKWQVQLQKPARRSRKFPDGEATPEDDAPAPVETPSVTAAGGGDSEAGNVARSPRVGISLKEGAKRATDRDLFDAVATLLPEAAPVGADSIRPEPEETVEETVSPGNEDEALHWVDGVGPVSASDRRRFTVRVSIPVEDLLRAACRMLTSALDLDPEKYHVYSCGVLDLVHALTEEEV